MKPWLHRTFVDLTEPPSLDVLTHWGVELAARSFFDGIDLPRFRSFQPRFRPLLAAELGLLPVAVDDPRQMHAAEPWRRSARWQALCAGVEAVRALPADDVDRLLWLLHRLGFNRLVADLARSVPQGAPQSATMASIAYTVALARSIDDFEQTGAWSDRHWHALLQRFTAADPVRVHASYHLAQSAGRERRDAAATRLAVEAHRRECEALAPSLSRFDGAQVRSRLWRVAAFVPQLEGDMDGMFEMMERSRQELGSVTAESEAEDLCLRELRWPWLESQMKAARVAGDPSRALGLARDLVELAKLSATARNHLGECLLAIDEPAQALPEFRRAAAWGPAGTVEALAYVGQFAVAEGDWSAALDVFGRALALDPFAPGLIGAVADIPGVEPGFVAQLRASAEQERLAASGRPGWCAGGQGRRSGSD